MFSLELIHNALLPVLGMLNNKLRIYNIQQPSDSSRY